MISNKTAIPRPVPSRIFTHDQISACARRVWEKKGRPEGQDRDIWLETERRLIHWHKPSPDLGGAMANPEITFDSNNEPMGAIEKWMGQFGGAGSERSATSL